MPPNATVAVPPQPDGAEGDLLARIADLVRTRRLKTGEQLPSIRELAGALGATPVAVRNALLRAQSLGFVRVLPRAGTFLRTTVFDPARNINGASLHLAALPVPDGEANVFHLLEARNLLEVQIVGLAVERLRVEDLMPVRRELEAMLRAGAARDISILIDHDVRFHIEVARLSANGVLLDLEHHLMEQSRQHLLAMPWTPEKFEGSMRLHAAIFSALLNRDAEAARREMREHGQLAYHSLLHDIQRPVVLDDAAPRARKD
jgi:GntR family transcriptional repressor for pyruvate dehydrogenase complex